MKSGFLFILSFVLFTSLYSQPEKLEGPLNLFGYVDGDHSTILELTFMSKRVKGVLSTGKEKIHLSGQVFEDGIKLDEFLDGSDLGSYWKLKKTDSSWTGFWTDGKVALPAIFSEGEVDSFEGFLLRIETEGKPQWKIILQSGKPGSYSGSIFSHLKKKYFHVRGISGDPINLEIFDDSGNRMGRLTIAEKEAKQIGIQWEGEKTEFIQVKNSLRSRVERKQMSSLSSKVSFTYPTLDAEEFDGWVAQKVKPLFDRATGYASQVAELPFKAHLRNSVRANGEYQLQLVSDKWILGRISYWDSWSNKKMDEVLCFDMQEGKEVELKNLIGRIDEIQQLAIDELEQRPMLQKDASFLSWLKGVNHWNMIPRPDGLWIDAGFHPVYGTVGMLFTESQLATLGVSGDWFYHRE